METTLVKKNVPKVWSTPSFLTSRKYLVEPLGFEFKVLKQLELFHFCLNLSLVYGNPYYFFISYNLQKNALSLKILQIQTIRKARL